MNQCQVINELLSTFKPYTPKQKSRMAYEVKESDQIIESSDERFGILKTDKGLIKFTRNIEFVSYQVFPGDFIEIIKWPTVALHWPRANSGHMAGRCSGQKMARALATIVALCVCGSVSVFVFVSLIESVICSCI